MFPPFLIEQDILDRADQDVLQTLTPLARASILGFLEQTRPLDHADGHGKPQDHCNGGGVWSPFQGSFDSGSGERVGRASSPLPRPIGHLLDSDLIKT